MASARKLPTTYNTSTYGNGTRDYTSLSTWESATDNDLVTATDGEVLDCYDDSASFNDGVTLAGATTNSSYFRVVRPATGQGHDGSGANGVYFHRTTGGYVGNVGESYSQIHDLIGKLDINTALSYQCFRITGNEGAIVGCISRECADAGSGVPLHFGHGPASGDTCYFICCMAIKGTSNNGAFRIGAASATGYAYNCTGYDPGGIGILRSSGTGVVKNCLMDSTTDDYFGTFSGGTDYNASGDADVPGGNSRASQTFTFEDTANFDARITAADAGAKDYGTDLTGDSAYAFDDDIVGVQWLTFDIGCNEPNQVTVKSGSESVPMGQTVEASMLAILAVVETFKIGITEAANLLAQLSGSQAYTLGVTEVVSAIGVFMEAEAFATKVADDRDILVKVNVGL